MEENPSFPTLTLKKSEYKIKVEESKYPGLDWPIKTYRIQHKNVFMLESLRRHISDIKYKHLKFINIKTNDKYNDYLKNKIEIDISCIPLDQAKTPEVGTLVDFTYQTTLDKSVTHITTHNMINSESKLYIPDVYILVTKTKDKHHIQAKIALER